MRIIRCANATRLFGGCVIACSTLMIACSGCQAWRSAAVPGMASKQGERQVLRLAKHDPFPSPSDVGMKATK